MIYLIYLYNFSLNVSLSIYETVTSLIPFAFYIGFHARFKYEFSGFYINVDSLKCRFESV